MIWSADSHECVQWSDDNFWANVDAHSDTNTERAASDVYPKLLQVCTLALVLSIVSTSLIISQHCLRVKSPLKYYSRLLMSAVVFACGLSLLIAVISGNEHNNDIADPDTYTSESNKLGSCSSNSTKPYVGYVCALVGLLLVISLQCSIVRPRNCCFVNIREEEGTDEVSAYHLMAEPPVYTVATSLGVQLGDAEFAAAQQAVNHNQAHLVGSQGSAAPSAPPRPDY